MDLSSKHQNQLGRKLTKVLRHAPDSIGIVLDAQGWTSVDGLIVAMGAHGFPCDGAVIAHLVASSDKNRFELSDDGSRIRARQGHSVEIALDYESVTPPAFLYHGTALEFLPSILESGLDKRRRHHVHMSTDIAMMRKVGGRHGTAALLRIAARAMHNAGHVFYVTGNNVWLTDGVPPEYIALVDE